MLRKILMGLGGLLTAILILGFILPDRVQLSRETVISANQEDIFELVSNFQHWNTFSPWADIDPDAEYSLTGAGVGQTMSWTSDHPQVGNGKQTITKIDAPKMVTTELDFGDQGSASARFDLSHTPNGDVRVVWSFDTKMREGVPIFMQPISTYMKFFMEGMLGPQYELGLERLKKAAENSVAQTL